MFDDKNKVFFYVGLSLVILLLIAALVVSIYQAIAHDKDVGTVGILRDPQIVAIAIGLILSILVVERWRSLEGKVEAIAQSQVGVLKSIQDFAEKETEQRFEQIAHRAQSLSANVTSLVEKHPWLEVITERELIVETDSCRGIIRTSNSLLNRGNVLHLFEYLQYCAEKGITLRGTADDFYELATFCEIWLGDYYLSAQFLRCYVDKFPESSFLLLPAYIKTLLRVGDFGGVRRRSNSLRRKLYGNYFYHRFLVLVRRDVSVPEEYRWLGANVLALSDVAIRRSAGLTRYKQEISSSRYSTLFRIKQMLFDAELQIQLGEFDSALKILEAVDREELDLKELSDLAYLYSKVGLYDRSLGIREVVMAQYEEVFGDGMHNGSSRQGGQRSHRGDKRAQDPSSGFATSGKARGDLRAKGRRREPTTGDDDGPLVKTQSSQVVSETPSGPTDPGEAEKGTSR